ncbi:MAG: hypothetical protein RBU21_01415, partial [FCB group bacterium]|nr:hypothetical protein [FCB group bacterium]
MAGLFPLLCAALPSLWKSRDALQNAALGQLEFARSAKQEQIRSYFQERNHDLAILSNTIASKCLEAESKMTVIQAAQSAATATLFQKFVDDIGAQQDRSICTKAQEVYRAFIETGEKTPEYERYASIVDGFVSSQLYTGYYVVGQDGRCLYCAGGGPVLHADLLAANLAGSGLGRVVAKVRDTGEVAIEDFSAFEFAENAMVAFIGAPILNGGAKDGVIVLQIPADPINAIAQSRTGMSAGEDSYFVGRVNGETSYRNQRVIKEGVFGGKRTGDFIDEALGGKTGSILRLDIKGNAALTCFSPIPLPGGFEWMVATTQPLEDMFAGSGEAGTSDYLADYAKSSGYQDLELIYPEGQVFYTVGKKADYKSNVISGELKDSSLGRLVRTVLKSGAAAFADFEPYAPNEGMPVAFLG